MSSISSRSVYATILPMPHPHQALRLGRGEYPITEFVLETSDGCLEQGVLRPLQLRVQSRQLRQGGGCGHVVFLQHRADRPLALEPSTHQHQARPQQIARLAHPVANHMAWRAGFADCYGSHYNN